MLILWLVLSLKFPQFGTNFPIYTLIVDGDTGDTLPDIFTDFLTTDNLNLRMLLHENIVPQPH